MVDTMFLKSRRVLAGKSQQAMSQVLGITLLSYASKENGRYEFKDREKLLVADTLGFSLSDFNRAFYNGKLPM